MTSHNLISNLEGIEKQLGWSAYILNGVPELNLPEKFSTFKAPTKNWHYLDQSVDIVIAPQEKKEEAKRITRFGTFLLDSKNNLVDLQINDKAIQTAVKSVNNIQMQIDWIKGSASNRGKIFFSAPMMPEFDKESGSRRMFHLLLFLRKAGYDLYYFTTSEKDESSLRYSETLKKVGITTLFEADVSMENALKAASPLDFVLVPFYNYANAFMPIIQRAKGDAKLIVDSIDLHFVRIARKQFLAWGKLMPPFDINVVEELNTYRHADYVLTVSEKEADLLNNLFATTDKVFGIHDCELSLPRQGLSDRAGILFVGNYRHKPNLESLEYFLEKMLPHIDKSTLIDHPIHLVGNELPVDFIKTNYREYLPYLKLIGWVPAVKPYFQKARISVVPLTYGAGTKRKLLQSMIYATPAVTTDIGAEGFDLINGEHALIENDPVGFAQAINLLCQDDELWEKISIQSREYINSKHSFESVYRQVENFLAIAENGA